MVDAFVEIMPPGAPVAGLVKLGRGVNPGRDAKA